MLRKLVIAAVLLAVLAGVATVAWQACGMPPLRLVLKYGYPSPMGPTGRILTIEGVEFVEISSGYFRMGSHFLCKQGDLLGRICALLGLPWGARPTHRRECPLRWVDLPDGYWIARTEITNAQYERFFPGHPRFAILQEDELPKEGLSSTEARQYCAWLASKASLPVRLPSEEEWESACRAGSASEYCFGDDPSFLSQYAWYRDNSGFTANPVASLASNRWGLYDLHGNVSEWCECHASKGSQRHAVSGQSVQAAMYWASGGHYEDSARSCRSASRTRWPPSHVPLVEGLRPVISGHFGGELRATE